MTPPFQIGSTEYDQTNVLVIAELSANHNGDYERTLRLIDEAVNAGADAIKVQTYTADSMTIRSENEEFMISGGTSWDGKQLHDVYAEGAMPWDWQPKLAEYCREKGVLFFSTPFDFAAVDFLEEIGVPAYKVASFELTDIPLIERIGKTGKPIIISTGMGTVSEISDAVDAAKRSGSSSIAMLKCTSAYPADPADANLATIPQIAQTFKVSVGLSDHTMGVAVPVAAVALGAVVIEKHFTLSRDDGGVDSAFSLEPKEFASMVDAVRVAEKAIGEVDFGESDGTDSLRRYRRSLYVVKPIKAGDEFTETNVRAIRPGLGLPPKYYSQVLGRVAASDLPEGTPLSWEMVS
ncbi:MAG: pseudaminic acid synthase [Verrucomicrobiota bacterium]